MSEDTCNCGNASDDCTYPYHCWTFRAEHQAANLWAMAISPEKQAEIQAIDETLAPTERLRRALEAARKPE